MSPAANDSPDLDPISHVVPGTHMGRQSSYDVSIVLAVFAGSRM